MFLCFLVFFSVLDCISLLLMRLRHIFFKKNLCAHCEIESSYCWRDGWRGLRPKRGGGIACICPMYLCPLWWNLIEFIPPTVEQLCTLFPSDEGLTIDLKNFRKPGEKTFTQRSRLFVGNLPPDITEEEMRKLFEKYGKAGEVFIHKDKGFGFIRLVSDLLP